MRAGLLGLVFALAGFPAMAQTAPSAWVLASDPAYGQTTATAHFSGGQAIAVRCRSGQLDVLVAGLPALASGSRYVEVTPPGRPTEALYWPTEGDNLVSATPTYSARMLRRGGSLELSVALGAESDSALGPHRFELPAQSAPVDLVLEACGQPVTDPRDDLPRWSQPRTLPAGLWARRPVPEYPERAMRDGLGSGSAVLGCIVSDEGRLQDCRIERESDRGVGFGAAARASAGAARLSLTVEHAPQAGQVIILSLRFVGL